MTTDNKPEQETTYPPMQVKQRLPLNDVHTKPLDKVWSEPTPRK